MSFSFRMGNEDDVYTQYFLYDVHAHRGPLTSPSCVRGCHYLVLTHAAFGLLQAFYRPSTLKSVVGDGEEVVGWRWRRSSRLRSSSVRKSVGECEVGSRGERSLSTKYNENNVERSIYAARLLQKASLTHSVCVCVCGQEEDGICSSIITTRRTHAMFCRRSSG